jgi:rare lipoprotein A
LNDEMHMVSRKSIARLIGLALLCHIAFGAAACPVPAEEPVPATASESKEKASAEPQESEGVEGVAVYYAKRYQGRRTSSGERFDHKKLTAAHPTIPNGTRVKLINRANDRSTVVTVNDRCRKRSFEIIDVSRAAAAELGFLGNRKARVLIIPLTEE